MIDWTSTLKRQAELAAIARRKVNAVLDKQDITFTQASRIQQSISKAAKAFERVRQILVVDATVEDSQLEASYHLNEIWSGMLSDIENLMREMIGARVRPLGQAA